MSQPTTAIGFSPTTPAAPPGYVNATPQTDGGTPLQKVSEYVASVGGASAKTANYTAVAGDNGTLLSFNSASAVTLTLPVAPPMAVWKIAVQNIGAGMLTINRNGLDIDGAAANVTLSQGSGLEIFTDGTNYFTERGLSTLPTLFGYVGITIPASALASTGFQGTQSVPYSGTIVEWILLADGASCTAQITPSKASLSAFPTFTSIVASAPPVITSSQKATNTSLTGWTTAVNSDDVFSFNLDSYSGTASQLTLILKIQRSS
jgi:hypothetical protein